MGYNMKKLLLLLLSLVLVFALCACDDTTTTCTEHTDTDGDLKCDTCGATVEAPDDGGGDDVEDDTPLVLVEDSEAKFQLVISKMSGTKILNAAKDFVSDMKKLGVEITYVNDDSEASIKDCEIILGDVSSRGAKYDFDEHTLGVKGYVIKKIDNKIIITAGSTDAIIDVFEDFCKDVLGLKKGAKKADVANSSFDPTKDAVLKVQDDYRVTAIKVGSEEINGYTIAVDQSNVEYNNMALTLQKTLYERAGYWLPIVNLDEATSKSFVLKSVPKGENSPAGDSGFIVKTVNGQIQLLCAYDNAFTKAANALISAIVTTQGEYVFKDNSEILKRNVSVVYYKDWTDIKGDGETNDFDAIRALHEYANAGGQRVVAESGKEYYLESSGGKPIVIKTNVDFSGATFIIDDTYITGNHKERSTNVFLIQSDYDDEVYGANSDIVARINAAGGVKNSDATLPLNLGYDVFVKLTNADRRVYHRWGSGSTGPGVIQEEIMIVYADNTIESTTPVMFDFEKVTEVTVKRLDVEPITITGGTFITYAASYGMDSANASYTSRGMFITRPHTTITGIDHKVVEKETKVFYQGFINIRETTDVRVENTKLSGRGGTGTYDISLNWANDVTFYNCDQYNMFIPESGRVYHEQVYWGIMGSNYSKNVRYDSSTLSRFDAHAGVYNFEIVNCTIAQIKITGGGVGRIENCVIHNTIVASMREDYGTYWMGDLIIKDITLVNDNSGIVLLSGNVHDVHVHDEEMGFKTQMPNVYVENIELRNYESLYTDKPSLKVFNLNFDTSLYDTGKGECNEILASESITIINPENYSDIKIGDETLNFDLTKAVKYTKDDE